MKDVRLIDANFVASEMTAAYYENPQTEDEKIYNLALTVAGKLIRKAPTIDAVPVVRCGYCKHMMPDGMCDTFADGSIRPSVSDFCSYGEWKE